MSWLLVLMVVWLMDRHCGAGDFARAGESGVAARREAASDAEWRFLVRVRSRRAIQRVCLESVVVALLFVSSNSFPFLMVKTART